MGIKKVTIIGTGLIGSSLALSLKRQKICEEITGIDLPGIITAALHENIIDRGLEPTDIEKGVRDADLIFLATNINNILGYLPLVSACVKTGAIVTDVGSTKERIVSQAEKYFSNKVFFIGGHPMTGSEKSGITAADPLLFENCFYILSPIEQTPDKVVQKLADVLHKIGSKVLIMDAVTHDKIAATVSHLPQMLAVALVNFVERYNEKQPNNLKLAAGGFRDMTRIASSPFEMWQDIIETNQTNIVKIIDKFIDELNYFKYHFSRDDLENNFSRAAKTRLSIPKDTKGFLNPNFDISVVAEDKPGIIAKMATILANENINIRDIEVLKVRMLEGGSFRLSFESDRIRERAISLLNKSGFDCRKR